MDNDQGQVGVEVIPPADGLRRSGKLQKVEDATLNGGESVSAGNACSGVGRSKVGSCENVTREEGRGPPLKNCSLISKAPLGQAAVGGGGANNNDKGSSGASPVLEPPVALQNSVVLTKLFELCPPPDLARFRLVCKEWRDLSLKTWRESATIILKHNPDNGRFYIGKWTTLFKLLKYVENPGKECGVKPFCRIELKGLIFNHQRKQEIERFWALTGSNLTSLALNDCSFSDPEEFWRIPYILCPNLKRLCLYNCSFDFGQNVDHPSERRLKYTEPPRGKHGHLKCLIVCYSELPVSWLELLSHFDSLTSLDVNHEDSAGESLLNAIKAIKKHDGNKLPLKNFHVDEFRITHERNSHDKFAVLQEFNIPLKSLIISAHPDLNLEVVSDILEVHSRNLETLELKNTEGFRDPGRMNGTFQCRVQLEKLRHLCIDNVFMESEEILKSVPNLRSLYIGCEDDQVDRLNRLLDSLADWEADAGIVLLPKLTILTYSGFPGARLNLVTLAKFLPNVDNLEMTLNDDKFSTVCELWKGLKTLTVESEGQSDADHLTDRGLTGGSLQIEMPEMKWVHKAVRPNITDLTELRSFECYSNKLTDVSVYHGFLQLPNLQSVTFLKHDDSDESDDEDDENPRATPIPKPNCFGHDARTALQEKGIRLKLD